MDLSKALPTPSYSSLELWWLWEWRRRRRRDPSLFPLCRGQQRSEAGGQKQRGWSGEDSAAPGRGCREGSAGEKALPCHGTSQGHAGQGFGGAEPPQPRRITPRFCHPPSPPCAAMLSAGRAEGTGGRDAGTERGDTGLGGAAEPGPPHAQGCSAHLHPPLTSTAPRRGKLRHGPGRGEGPELGAAGRQRAGNELRLRKQQLPPGPALLGLPLPSPPRPSPAAGAAPGAPPLCAAADVAPRGSEQRDERHSATPAGLFVF